MHAGGARGPDWSQVQTLFEAALELPEPARGAFLDRSCANAALRRELDELLAASPAAARFFDRMARAVATVGPDLEPPDGDPLLGTIIGHYRVDDRLAAGGMGIVYRGFDVQLQRVVALKLLPPHVSADDRARTRFFVEARAAAALDHPNICTIHDVGETAEPRPFIAMAYYAGETLDRLMGRGPLPIAEAVAYAVQIARGLAAAHERGITHRDIKPGNVMINTDGAVKILDFGLATLPDAAVTRGEGTLGTIAYLSPERVQGHRADRRTDLWSLGVVLYEMVTGERPFTSDTDVGLLYAIVHHDPEPPVLRRPDLPAPMDALIGRLLQKDPADRHPDAGTVLEELESMDPRVGLSTQVRGSRRPEGAGPAGRRAARWLPRGVAIYAGLAGTAAALVWILRSALAGPTPAIDVGTAPPSVAVLYFQDETDTSDGIDWLASALTGSLITTLGRIQGIQVLSMNATRPYRDGSHPVRTVADDLDARWLIGGFVHGADGHVVVNAELIEGATGRRLGQREARRPTGEERALIDDAVRAVAAMLRDRLGVEIRLARTENGPANDEATRLLYIAGSQVDLADQLIDGGTPAEAWAALRLADSTLGRAAAADPGWAEPLVERAWLANRSARVAFGIGMPPDSARARFRNGVDYATAALALRGDSAAALEARGVLLHTWSLVSADRDSASLRLAAAEGDLHTAVDLDGSLPRALSTLSAIHHVRGRFDEARLTAERAYRADPFLDPEEALGRLFNRSFEAGRDARAAEWCAETASRFPESWLVANCRLTLMVWSPVERVDPDAAWRRIDDAIATTPAPERTSARAQLEILAAGVLARAGQADSARRVLAHVHARAPIGPESERQRNNRIVQLPLEAGVRILLAEPEGALRLLEQYFAEHPDERTHMVRSRRFATLFRTTG